VKNVLKNHANHLIMVLAMIFSSSAYAGFYFDVGSEIGRRLTAENYKDCSFNGYPNYDFDCYDNKDKYSGIGTDFGLRIGGGPSTVGYGLFFVGDIGATTLAKHFFVFTYGPGFIFYPMRELQLGSSFSLGIIKGRVFYPGYGYNVSVAYDIGERNHGLLVGFKYSNISGELNGWTGNFYKIESQMIGVFIKYAYRKKDPSIEDEEVVSSKQPKNQQKSQSPLRTFAVKNFDKIAEDNQSEGGEHLNSLILLMESEGTPKDEALLLIKRAIRKANGNAESFANELESSAE
jgi:hypothetical protein